MTDIRCGDCLSVMPTLPENSVDSIITDLTAGIAAEHLVCADLLLSGYRAFLADQNCPYDVAVELDGHLIRIQVKGTRQPKKVPQRSHFQTAYQFHTRRAGKHGKRRYADGEFDVLALVALDARLIGYLPFVGVRDDVFIRVPGAKYGGKDNVGRQFADLTFQKAVSPYD